MWDYLIGLDLQLFYFINQTLSWDLLDQIMPLWRSKYFWIPLYVFLLALIAQTFKKRSWVICLGIIATIALADTTSSKLIKKNIKRLRPCNTEHLSEKVNLLVHCGTGYSFTSSHATNHFALAAYLVVTLCFYYRRLKWWLVAWAGTIALGQVYVGVHYPSDIFVGALVGIHIGYLIGWIAMATYHKLGPAAIAE